VRWPPPLIVAGILSESLTGIRSGSVTVYAGIHTGGIIIWNRESQMESWLKQGSADLAFEVCGSLLGVCEGAHCRDSSLRSE